MSCILIAGGYYTFISATVQLLCKSSITHDANCYWGQPFRMWNTIAFSSDELQHITVGILCSQFTSSTLKLDDIMVWVGDDDENQWKPSICVKLPIVYPSCVTCGQHQVRALPHLSLSLSWGFTFCSFINTSSWLHSSTIHICCGMSFQLKESPWQMWLYTVLVSFPSHLCKHQVFSLFKKNKF